MTPADRARPVGCVTVSEEDAGEPVEGSVRSEGFIVAAVSVPRYCELVAPGPDDGGVMTGGVLTQRRGSIRMGSVAAVAAGETDAYGAGEAPPARQRRHTTFGRAGHAPIRFTRLHTPVGPLFVGATDAGVCDVSFGLMSEQDYRDALHRRAPTVWRDDRSLTEVVSQIVAYFNGALRRFSLPLDLGQVTPFTARVLSEIQEIRFGRLISYGELAARLGSPGASRAVGGALGRNPTPIVIPCHRVIARGGGIGGFTGGLATKRILLAHEGHRFADDAAAPVQAGLTGMQDAANGGAR